eukprot:gene14849-biopygen12670
MHTCEREFCTTTPEFGEALCLFGGTSSAPGRSCPLGKSLLGSNVSRVSCGMSVGVESGVGDVGTDGP